MKDNSDLLCGPLCPSCLPAIRQV